MYFLVTTILVVHANPPLNPLNIKQVHVNRAASQVHPKLVEIGNTVKKAFCVIE